MKQTSSSHEIQELTEMLFMLLRENAATIADLKSENNTLKNIIELLPGNVYWKNLKGEFVGGNRNMIKIGGNSIIGKSVTQLFGETIGDPIERIDNMIMREGKEHTIEEEGVTVNGQSATYLSKKLPLHDVDGKIIGTMGISFNITDRKRMERQLKEAKEKAEASDRAKSQFVAAVNHELRTPLSSILGLIDIFREEEITDRDLEKITTSIESSAKHLLNLVDDVLDFSKLENSKQDLKLTPVNLAALINDIHDLFYPLIKNKDIKLTLLMDPALPEFVQSDARVLRHILINLINNAVKYTIEGEITVQIQIVEQSDKQVKLKLSISDTGLGIPEDKLKVIFQPFQQLNNTRIPNSSRNGVGLGLSIVKKLVEAIEGTLDVESTVGKGSTFSLISTFTICNEETMHPFRKQITNIQRIIKPHPTVLIVEDDPIIQYIHRKLLSNLGCVVDIVATSADAMRILNKTHDLVLLDMSLPDERGYELIKKIRGTTSFTCPIIVISAFMEKKEEIACLEAGASESLIKPISQAKLKEILERYCSTDIQS